MTDAATRKSEIEEAESYLRTGGLGEVIGLTDMAFTMDQPKVQMDTSMAMALCLLAANTISCLRCRKLDS